jgi:hypothetical protein
LKPANNNPKTSCKGISRLKEILDDKFFAKTALLLLGCNTAKDTIACGHGGTGRHAILRG